MKRKIIMEITLLIAFVSLTQLYKDKKVLDVSENLTKKSLAIMVYDEDESNYVSANSVPIGNYKLNETLTYCEAGGSVSNYDKTAGTVKIKTLGQDECYLYFDVGISEPSAYCLQDTYTSSQTITIPEARWYQIEVFGASGNGGALTCDASPLNSTDSTTYEVCASGGGGGGGGYANSRVLLDAGDEITVTIGASGETTSVAISSSFDSYDTIQVTSGGAGTDGIVEYNASFGGTDEINISSGTGGASGTATGGNYFNINGGAGGDGEIKYYRYSVSQVISFTVTGGTGGESAYEGGNVGGTGGGGTHRSYYLSVADTYYWRTDDATVTTGSSGLVKIHYGCSDGSSSDTVIVNSLGIKSTESYNSKNVVLMINVPSSEATNVSSICISETNDSANCTWEDSPNWTQSTTGMFTKAYTLSVEEGSGTSITLYAFIKDTSDNISTINSASYTLYEECAETTTTSTSGTCSVSCGGGTKTVTDTVKDKYLGTTCSTNSYTATCNTQSCNTSNTCTDWTAWTACNSSCPTGATYYRTCTTTGVTTKEYRYD